MAKSKYEGIEVRHQGGCPANEGKRCRCNPSYRACVWSARDRKPIRKTFRSLAEAKGWRADAIVALRRGTLRPQTRLRLDQVADAWLEGAREGAILNRSGDPYKPSALRGYEQALRLRVLPALGGYKLADIRSTDVQDFADQLIAQGLTPSVIRNTMLPLRVIFGRAVSRGEVGINPVDNVKIPAVRTKSDRVASPEEAAQLLAVLPAADRPLWATALYAGLRLGELMALRWEDVDLGAGKLRVSRSWDPKEGMIEPKSRAGVRTVPIATVLRDYLTEHRMDSTGEGLVFGRSESKPFGYWVIRRSIKRWEGLGLEPITPHAARHTFASLMIAAGVNAKALSTYMGHANIAVTYDRYGHLMPGSEEEAAGLLDAYLERAVTDAPLDRLPD